MKAVLFLVSILVFSLPPCKASDAAEKALGFCAGYTPENGGLTIFPYKPLWFRNQMSSGPLFIQPGDLLVQVSTHQYHEYQFERLTSSGARFSHRVYSCSYGPAISGQQSVLKGPLLSSETFSLPNRMVHFIVDLPSFVGTRPSCRLWRSRMPGAIIPPIRSRPDNTQSFRDR